MKKLVMDISCCAECPFNSYDIDDSANMWASICTEIDAIIEDDRVIMKCCPLEDL